MLWKKGWYETRSRVLIVLAVVVVISVLTMGPPPSRGGRIRTSGRRHHDTCHVRRHLARGSWSQDPTRRLTAEQRLAWVDVLYPVVAGETHAAVQRASFSGFGRNGGNTHPYVVCALVGEPRYSTQCHTLRHVQTGRGHVLLCHVSVLTRSVLRGVS